jgi:hypothetical protein
MSRVDSLLRPKICETTFLSGEPVVHTLQYEHFGSSFKNSQDEVDESPAGAPGDAESVSVRTELGLKDSGDGRNNGLSSWVCVAMDVVRISAFEARRETSCLNAGLGINSG